MNGKDLNNMAQRYKEEMMRLYQKSSAKQGIGNNTSPAMNNAFARDLASQQSATMPADYPSADARGNGVGANGLPVNCTCRFPTAESIINSIVNTPMTLPITPEDDPPAVYSENTQGSGARNASTSSAMPESILLNSSPTQPNYDIPSAAENEREVFPDFLLPVDIPAENSEVTPDTANFAPSTDWVAMTGDNSWGFLKFEVFTADGAVPVPGALITIRKSLPEGSGLIRLLFTNRSGKSPTIALPAPAQSYSQYPGSTVRPFSEYNVTVRAKGYYTLREINIPIFAGIKTVQPIDLIPLAEYSGQIQPRNDADVG